MNVCLVRFHSIRASGTVALLLALLLSAGASAGAPSNAPVADPPAAPFASANSSVLFIENVGQFAPAVRYQVRGGVGTLWLANDALWLTVARAPARPSREERLRAELVGAARSGAGVAGWSGVNLRLRFVGASQQPQLEAFNRREVRVSYFRGNDPSRWRPEVPVWGGVRYRELYPNLDLEVAEQGGGWALRLVARPGANLEAVRLRIEGADRIAVEDGRLRLDTAAGPVVLPLLQVVAPGTASLAAPRVEGNEVFAPWSERTVALGPALPTADTADLIYSTFLGGSQNDEGRAIVVDATGAAYITGSTLSFDFPTTPGAWDQTYSAKEDVFVTKLSPSGSSLVYSTFLGDDDTDDAWNITVDGSGAAYVVGHTLSRTYPVTFDSFDPSYGGGGDGFLTKLNPSGTGLVYSGFLGGTGDDEARAVVLDAGGNAYVTGMTASSNFPTTVGAYDTTFNGVRDAYVAKINSTGTAYVYSTYLGGSGTDSGRAIGVDPSGAVYVTGPATSVDFPTTPGAFDTTIGGVGADGFVTKLNSSGSALVYSTFLGGSEDELPRGLVVDGAGLVYTTGLTYSGDFPSTGGAYDTTCNGCSGTSDVYVTKLNGTGSALIYSTFLGSTSWDEPRAIALESATGAVVVTGDTNGADFPTTASGYDQTFAAGGDDAFVTKLNAAGSALEYSTYLGGTNNETGGGIALDPLGAAYTTGFTWSSDFPATPGAYDSTCTPCPTKNDAFVAKLGLGRRADLAVTKSDSPDPVSGGQTLTYTLTVTNAGPSTATNVTVTDTLPSGVTFVSATASQGSCSFSAGTVSCTLGSLSSGGSATITIQVVPNAGGTITNTATVSASETDPNTANNSDSESTTVIPQADLALTKSDAPDPVLIWQNVTYSLTATNGGPGASENVTLTDPLPPGAVFLSATASQGRCSFSAGTVSCALGTIPSGGSASVTIVVQFSTSGTKTNSASVSSSTPDPNGANNSASATTTVNATTFVVNMTDSLRFVPDTLVLSPGQSIAWVNTSSVTHTTTSETGLWDSGSLAPGRGFSFVFGANGTYLYRCTIHTSPGQTIGMVGSVIVGALDVNTSFETDANGDGTPDSWSRFGLSGGDTLVNDPNTGSRAFQIQGAALLTKALYQRFLLNGSAGERFSISGWSKSTGASPSGGLYAVVLRFEYTNGSISQHVASFTRSAHDWERVAGTFAAQQNFRALIVAVVYQNQSGTATFDDVTVTRAAP